MNIEEVKSMHQGGVVATVKNQRVVNNTTLVTEFHELPLQCFCIEVNVKPGDLVWLNDEHRPTAYQVYPRSLEEWLRPMIEDFEQRAQRSLDRHSSKGEYYYQCQGAIEALKALLGEGSWRLL